MALMHKAFDGTEFDIAALPDASLRALVARGYGHIMSNEVASAVGTKIKNHIAVNAEPKRKVSDVTTDELKAFRTANESMVEGWTTEAQATKHAAMLAGELGIRAASTAVNPLDRAMLAIARQEIRALFKRQGWAFPTKADETFRMGDSEFSGDELVDRWLNGEDKSGAYGKAGEANAPRIERIAEKQLRDKANAAKQVAQADTSSLAASLGL